METRLLSIQEAADFLGLKVSTLYKFKMLDIGPAYVKLGTRTLYRSEKLSEYIEAHSHEPGQRKNASRAKIAKAS
jgi:predicted DNA-binding transcriptional regulator AlpA